MVSRACPFCGGPQIVKREGEYICAYCLQPLDFSNGKLSDGYNKLASFNFAGAASFFAQASGEGAEALYGLFLARNKIEENRTKSGVTPIIYTYRPESFETDPDYISLKTACAGERALLKKLEKIEEARRTTLEPTRACDAVIFYDPGTIAESAEFADELSSRGYEVLRTSDFSAADIATLRCARAAYAFASSEYTVQKLAESKVARRYALLENSRGTMG